MRLLFRAPLTLACSSLTLTLYRKATYGACCVPCDHMRFHRPSFPHTHRLFRQYSVHCHTRRPPSRFRFAVICISSYAPLLVQVLLKSIRGRGACPVRWRPVVFIPEPVPSHAVPSLCMSWGRSVRVRCRYGDILPRLPLKFRLNFCPKKVFFVRGNST